MTGPASIFVLSTFTGQWYFCSAKSFTYVWVYGCICGSQGAVTPLTLTICIQEQLLLAYAYEVTNIYIVCICVCRRFTLALFILR